MDAFVALLFDYKFRNCQIPMSQEQSVKYAFLYIATLVPPIAFAVDFCRQRYDEIFLEPAQAVLAIRRCRARLRCKISTKHQESGAKVIKKYKKEKEKREEIANYPIIQLSSGVFTNGNDNGTI